MSCDKPALAPLVSLRRVAADSSEIAHLYSILVACGLDMEARLGLRHWAPPYPLADMVAHAAERSLWAVEVAARSAPGASGAGAAAVDDAAARTVVGTVTTGFVCNVPYLLSLAAENKSLWADAGARAIYVGKLAVEPSLQGRGLGAAALAAVESQARAEGAQALRLDALRDVPNLPRFYKAAGFDWRAQVTATDAHGVEHILDVWEKVL